jgi:hypothetical protein
MLNKLLQNKIRYYAKHSTLVYNERLFLVIIGKNPVSEYRTQKKKRGYTNFFFLVERQLKWIGGKNMNFLSQSAVCILRQIF